MSFRGFCWLLLALVPVYALLAAVIPPFDDELYYWCWSRELQLSYYDHPPMVAYLIRGATELLGDSALALRLPAILSATIVTAVIGWLTQPRDLLPFVLLTPVFTFAAVLVTPDTPLLMFWALYLAWLVAVHERLAQRDPIPLWLWVLGGLVLGCGVLGKYTTGLAAIAGGVSFLFAGDWRRWAGGYVLHALVSVAVASPILVHNLRYDFLPIRYQWAHSMSSPNPGLGVFAEFVGVQVLLIGTLPFAVFVWAILNRRELLADPRLRVCLCLFVLPFAFFLWKATRGRLEGNWAFPSYIACWPLVAEWYRRVRESPWWRYTFRAGFIIPLGASVFFSAHLVYPIDLFPAKADRAYRQWERIAAAQRVAADLRTEGYTGPVYLANYQWVAVFRWAGIDARQVTDGARPSHFTERGGKTSREIKGYAFIESPDAAPRFLDRGDPGATRCYPFTVRGVPHEPCWLLDYSGGTGHAGTARGVPGGR